LEFITITFTRRRACILMVKLRRVTTFCRPDGKSFGPSQKGAWCTQGEYVSHQFIRILSDELKKGIWERK
jgi:hypothetical protein